MKQLLLVFVVLFVAWPAQGQTAAPNNGRVSLTMKGAPRTTILTILAEQVGLKVAFDDPIPDTDTWTGELTDVPVATAFEKVLPAGYEAIPDANFTIHVRRKASPLSALPTPVAPLAVPSTQPLYGDTRSWVLWARTASHEDREAFRLRRMRPDYDPCIYGDAGCDRNYYNGRLPVVAGGIGYSTINQRSIYVRSGNYRWQPDGYLWDFFNQQCNRKMYGLLKIDGPDREHQEIRVKIDDLDKGVASKYDQKVNGAIVIRVRESCDDTSKVVPVTNDTTRFIPEARILKLQFIREHRGERPRRVTRFVQIEPFEVTGFENLMWMRIDKDDFQSAEIVDPLEQQGLPASEEKGPVASKVYVAPPPTPRPAPSASSTTPSSRR